MRNLGLFSKNCPTLPCTGISTREISWWTSWIEQLTLVQSTSGLSISGWQLKCAPGGEAVQLARMAHGSSLKWGAIAVTGPCHPGSCSSEVHRSSRKVQPCVQSIRLPLIGMRWASQLCRSSLNCCLSCLSLPIQQVMTLHS